MLPSYLLTNLGAQSCTELCGATDDLALDPAGVFLELLLQRIWQLSRFAFLSAIDHAAKLVEFVRGEVLLVHLHHDRDEIFGVHPGLHPLSPLFCEFRTYVGELCLHLLNAMIEHRVYARRHLLTEFKRLYKAESSVMRFWVWSRRSLCGGRRIRGW